MMKKKNMMNKMKMKNMMKVKKKVKSCPLWKKKSCNHYVRTLRILKRATNKPQDVNGLLQLTLAVRGHPNPDVIM